MRVASIHGRYVTNYEVIDGVVEMISAELLEADDVESAAQFLMTRTNVLFTAVWHGERLSQEDLDNLAAAAPRTYVEYNVLRQKRLQNRTAA